MTTRDVVCTFKLANLSPASGTVSVHPNVPLWYPGGPAILANISLEDTLDNQGQVSFSGLLTTDTAGVEPSGWAYVLTIRLTGSPVRSYLFSLPAGGSALDLGTVTPLEPVPPGTEYIRASTMTTKGDLLTRTASGFQRIPVGANNQYLTPDSTLAAGLKWIDLPSSADPTALIAAHNADATDVHGISDTAGLETSAGATAKVSSHTAAVDPHGDRAYADAQTATRAALSHTHGASDVVSGVLAYARLPVGSTANTVAPGDDSRITGAAQKSANLSDLANPATARSNLALGGAALLSVGTGSGTVAAGDDSRFTASREVFPILEGYGFVAASGDPMHWGAPGTISNNDIYWARIWVPAGKPITGLYIPVRVAGTWDSVTGPNQIKLFDDTGAALDATPDTGTMWTTIGWGGGNIGTQIPAQSAGRFVYALATVHGVTGAATVFPHNPNDANGPWLGKGPGGTNRRGGYASGASLPASINPASYGTVSSYMPLIGVK